ncbi:MULTISPECIES: histidine triad nucleotide-binding protein [unclassified Brachybacterium]|uniref:histidine triad nucleotide-binding protein n=1 Tax=unclassified Brachybacterium TaxID=2623841 RepID=UPI000C7FE57C|nr:MULTISPECIES: histidine triad nucleotide-binding protein [unclassified Brachybacterium]PMC75410.1 histidine triad nucleotide-binding protein [Brachybacterium sp. UMB0905]
MGTSTTETSALRRDAECIFCKIVADEIPSDRVHEDERVIAFKDLQPQAPVHVLVVPREHHRDVTELAEDPQLLSHVVDTARDVAAQQADGDFRLVFNTGAGAGQTVFHVHAHVLAGGQLAEGEL